jgi:membrane associated rhomboid family serine protease
MSLAIRLVFLMWLVYTIQVTFELQLAFLGIEPRTVPGLIGLVTGPLIHGSALHIVSNTIPLLFLSWTLSLFYERISTQVLLLCYFLTNVLVWLLARPSVHVGASGMVYGIASFLIFYGVFSRDMKSIMISVIIILLYGGLVWGLLPNQPGVSWESHLIGAGVGVMTALLYARQARGAK